MKHLLLTVFLGLLVVPAMADLQDEASMEHEWMTERGWRYIGCVSQPNGVSLCRRKAEKQGYSQSRVQQDYRCNPRVFLTCYGLVADSSEDLSAENRGSCGGYVKPATCESHHECKWVGSCVDR